MMESPCAKCDKESCEDCEHFVSQSRPDSQEKFYERYYG